MRKATTNDAVVTMVKSSPSSVEDTVAHLLEMEAEEVKVTAVIHQTHESQEATAHDWTTVREFQKSDCGAPVKKVCPLVFLELLLRVLVDEEQGRTRVSYRIPAPLAERCGFSSDFERLIDEMVFVTGVNILSGNDKGMG